MNVYGKNYKKLRIELLEKYPLCQFCGNYKSIDAHHWALKYPDDKDLLETDLTMLCSYCHSIATNVRRALKQNADPDLIIHLFENAINKTGLDIGSRPLSDKQTVSNINTNELLRRKSWDTE